MNFQSFVEELGEALGRPLPGHSAQLEMIPDYRVKHYYNEFDMLNARKGAVLVLFFQRNKDIIFPMIKRQEYEGVHSGQIAFPGGKKDPTDPDFSFTALRETYEEIGVPMDKIKILGKLTELYIPPSNFLVYPYVGYILEEPKYYPDLNEVADVLEFKVRDLLDNRCVSKHSTTLFNGLQVTTPCFEFDGKVVWGGTAMMLSELKTLLQKLNVPFLRF